MAIVTTTAIDSLKLALRDKSGSFLSDADKWARIMRARMTIECKM